MWQILAQQAMDIARERTEEARMHALASEARAMAEEERRRHGTRDQPGPVRAITAATLRRVSAGFGAVADVAHEAARRLDERTA